MGYARHCLAAGFLFLAAACTAPDTSNEILAQELGLKGQPAEEGLTGKALQERLSGQRLTLVNPARDRAVWMDLDAGGTGTTTALRDGKIIGSKPLRWRVSGGQLCAADKGDPLDCARVAMSGNNVTLRWTSGGRSRILAGTIGPA